MKYAKPLFILVFLQCWEQLFISSLKMSNMTDKISLIKTEIEEQLDSLYKELPDASKVERGVITTEEAVITGRYTELESLLDFINSLPEEPVSEDLELAATKYAQDKYMPVQTSQAFKAGAQWQANQGVTKEAVIGMATEEIALDVSEHTLDALDLYPGDKVIIQIRKKED